MNTLILLKQFDWRGKKVLDLGAGGGQLSLALAESGAMITAVDKDATFLTKFDHPNIVKVLSDLLRFDIEPQAYDLIIARNVLPFLGKNLHAEFSKIARGVNMDGKIFCSFFGERDAWKNKENILCLNAREILDLVAVHNLKIHYQEIEEGIAPTMAGPTKYWHVLSFLLLRGE